MRYFFVLQDFTRNISLTQSEPQYRKGNYFSLYSSTKNLYLWQNYLLFLIVVFDVKNSAL